MSTNGMSSIRHGDAIFDATEERVRAHAKHVDSPAGSREQTPWNDPLWLPIIVEEVGEIARALNDAEPLGRLRDEVIQAAAMCLAYADAIEEGMGREVVGEPYRVCARLHPDAVDGTPVSCKHCR